MIFSIYLIVSLKRKQVFDDPYSQVFGILFRQEIFNQNKKPPTENKKPPTENKKPPTENHATSNNFMGWYVVKYGRYSQTEVGAEGANVGLLEAVFGLFLRGFIRSKSSSEC